MSALLEILDLQTRFSTDEGTVKAVDGVSFDLREGETLALVGESGCGKSITALSIMGLIPSPPGQIVGGRIVFKGQDLRGFSSAEMRRIRGNQIAMIFQEPMTSLNPVLTIGRQIAEVLELHKEMDRRSAWKRAAELLDMVGIPDAERRLTDYPHRLSGGMRQRVMIAMAVSCEPQLLIADEPTTALDVTIQAQILELIQRLKREFSTAVILITHNLGIVARYADRVNVMYAGKIVEQGVTKDIYQNPHHPYTIGLLASVPRLDRVMSSRLVPIEGNPPRLIDPPPGCRFRPRCIHAIERCAQDSPQLETIENQHLVACWAKEKARASQFKSTSVHHD